MQSIWHNIFTVYSYMMIKYILILGFCLFSLGHLNAQKDWEKYKSKNAKAAEKARKEAALNEAQKKPVDNVEKQLVVYYYDYDSTKVRGRGYVSGSGFSDLGKKLGEWRFFYENGKVEEVANYVRGYLHGKVTQYYQNGNKKNEGYFYWNVQDSIFRAWNEAGKLVEKGNWSYGKRLGKWTFNYPDGKPYLVEEYQETDSIPLLWSYFSRDGKEMVKNGNGQKIEYYQKYQPKDDEKGKFILPDGALIKEKYTYKNGEINGAFEEYHSNGKKSVFGDYNMGEKTGLWRHWHRNGRLVRSANYKNGKLHGDFARMYLRGESTLVKNEGEEAYMQGQVQVRGTYDEGVKVGLWEWFAKDGSKDLRGEFKNDQRDGKWEQWHPNGQLASVGFYERDLRTGKWEKWFPNGQLEAVGYFENDLKTGDWKFYFETGELWKEGGFDKGLRQGLWITYFENGNKVNQGTFEKGKEDGVWQSWYANGQMMDEGTFKMGSMDGPWRGWYSNGKPRYEGTRKNDLETGLWKYYFEDGDLYQEGEYKIFKRKNAMTQAYDKLGHDYSESARLNEYEYRRKHGEWKTYSQKDKKLASIGTFSEGQQDGVWKHFNPGGKVVGIEETYKNGKLNGPSRSYTLRGRLISEINYKDGIKHGDMKVFNKKGKLAGHKIYKNGALHKDVLEGKKYKYK